MKKIYWQLHTLPRFIMIFACVFSLTGLFCVEHFKKAVPQRYYREKIEAATLTNQAFAVLKTERLHKKIPIDLDIDPANSGLIGEAITTVTTEHGDINAKQTTLNPNMAALIVEWFKRIGIKKNDVIAIGMTGSFPALNVAVLAAAKTLELKPIIIVSASASQWGANIPGFLWLDMQQTLVDSHLIPFLPVAASLGGVDDVARGLSEAGKRTLIENIIQYKIPFITAKNAEDAIDQRMRLYERYAGNAHIKAYINIGGSTVSYGKHHGTKHHLKPGLNLIIPYTHIEDSVMTRFMKQSIPVINLRNIADLAHEYNLPLSPTQMPPVGQGSLLYQKVYNDTLVWSVLVSIILLLVIVAILNKEIFKNQTLSEMEFPGV